jgi:nicotinamide-nucleotide adenylyltransferase
MWASYLKSSLPHFDKVYSGNDYVVMLLANSGYAVVPPKFLDRDQYSATKIRQMIANDGQWEKLVPSAVSQVIKKINGVKRIKTIFQSETKPQEY